MKSQNASAKTTASLQWVTKVLSMIFIPLENPTRIAEVSAKPGLSQACSWAVKFFPSSATYSMPLEPTDI